MAEVREVLIDGLKATIGLHPDGSGQVADALINALAEAGFAIVSIAPRGMTAAQAAFLSSLPADGSWHAFPIIKPKPEGSRERYVARQQCRRRGWCEFKRGAFVGEGRLWRITDSGLAAIAATTDPKGEP